MTISLDVNTENEQVVLGALLNDAEALRREVPHLPADLFVLETHRDLVEALREILRRGADYAADTVVQITGGKVGLKYLRDLEKFDALPEENLKFHLQVLRTGAAKYAATDAFGRLYAALDDAHAPLDDAEEAALEVLRHLRTGAAAEDDRRGRDLWEGWFKDLEEVRSRRAETFAPTFFSGLDRQLFEGLKPGKIVVVAGRPGMGKSTWCANLAGRMTLRDRRVLFAPVEAGRESVIEQIACARARVDAEKVVKSPDALTAEEMHRLKVAVRQIFDPGNLVVDDAIYSLDALEMKVEEEDYHVVILDLFEYLLPDLDSAFVTQELRRLKKLAKRRGFCAVVVQQIRRIKRKRNPRPQLHELKNSGGYEEVADLVLLLHRDKYFDPDSQDQDVLEVKVAKQRRGPQNVTVGFEFFPNQCRVGKDTTDFVPGT